MSHLASAAHFDQVAQTDAGPRRTQAAFHRQIAQSHRRIIPPASRVLEWGCGKGDLLRVLAPNRGLGLDYSAGMIAAAKERATNTESTQCVCEFRTADIQTTRLDEQFDYIVLNFLIGYLDDIQQALQQLQPAAHPRTRLVLTSLNQPWLWPLRSAQKLGWVSPQPLSNWLTSNDLINLLELAGWEVIESSTQQLLPFDLPLLTPFLNRFLVKIPLFRACGISIQLVARPRMPLPGMDHASIPACSVIVPMRNEAGNVRDALARIPTLGHGTEIIFVEGNSTDNTLETLEREIAAYQGPHQVRLLRQSGRGKWDAVRTGFDAATGHVLIIQDGDLTAPPEDLPKFFSAIISGGAEFANGSRLVYPMEKRAMRFLNFLGNKFFALTLSYVLGQPIKDSLCGTKALLRTDYYRLRERIVELGDFDPFGDFNLLFGAALLHLRIRDIPVRYKDRTYGETNISRFAHGWLLLRMSWLGLRRIKFA